MPRLSRSNPLLPVKAQGSSAKLAMAAGGKVDGSGSGEAEGARLGEGTVARAKPGEEKASHLRRKAQMKKELVGS